jgi:hemoglobin
MKKMKDLSYILIAIIVVIIIFAIWYYQMTQKVDTNSLYNRLGGIYNIAAGVTHFSDSLVLNPIVGQCSSNSFLRDWNTNHLDRLPGLKWMRTLWICNITGGPYKYISTKQGRCPFSLENAHSTLHISSAEFDEVARCLSTTLDHFNVPAQEKSEVLAAFAAHKSQVVNGQAPAKCPF